MTKFFRVLMLFAVAFVALQFFFLLKIALMSVISPESTSFQRSEMWRVTRKYGEVPWRQEWVSYTNMSDGIKQAVIASEDGDFVNHAGVEWDAIESAWTKNAKAQVNLEKKISRAQAKNKRQNTASIERSPKIIGGSTISQQLAKNLFLSGERSFIRKAQEFLITQLLELVLSKRQILAIYLNNVEWGEGVFGAEAAAHHYFRKSAMQLSNYEAARLAVMLPRPKFFEKQSSSSYLAGRASTIVARMPDAELPD